MQNERSAFKNSPRMHIAIGRQGLGAVGVARSGSAVQGPNTRKGEEGLKSYTRRSLAKM
jgi:hypothetical protein